LFGKNGLFQHPEAISLKTASMGSLSEAIFRQLAILGDVRPLLEDCCSKITVRFGFRSGAQSIRLDRVSLSQVDLSVVQQQLCKIVGCETVVLCTGKLLFCVLDFAFLVFGFAVLFPLGVGKNSGMTA
jgi:hypothetical protein